MPSVEDGARIDELCDWVLDLDRLILTTMPAGRAGAAVILGRLGDPKIGIDAGPGPHDRPALKRVFDVVEREFRRAQL